MEKSDFNTFMNFINLMGFKYDKFVYRNEIYVRADDSKKSSICQTIGYDDIILLGVFNEFTGQALELYNVSHVAHWPEGAEKLDTLFFNLNKDLKNETK